MPLLLARIVASVALFCAAFFLFIMASGNPDNGMLLIFPFFGAIPAIIGALVLFVPAEALLDRLGVPALKNVVVPLLGGTIVVLTLIILGATFDNLAVVLNKMRSSPVLFWGATAAWSLLGVAWGVVWRMTDWIASRFLSSRAC